MILTINTETKEIFIDPLITIGKLKKLVAILSSSNYDDYTVIENKINLVDISQLPNGLSVKEFIDIFNRCKKLYKPNSSIDSLEIEKEVIKSIREADEKIAKEKEEKEEIKRNVIDILKRDLKKQNPFIDDFPLPNTYPGLKPIPNYSDWQVYCSNNSNDLIPLNTDDSRYIKNNIKKTFNEFPGPTKL